MFFIATKVEKGQLALLPQFPITEQLTELERRIENNSNGEKLERKLQERILPFSNTSYSISPLKLNLEPGGFLPETCECLWFYQHWTDPFHAKIVREVTDNNKHQKNVFVLQGNRYFPNLKNENIQSRFLSRIKRPSVFEVKLDGSIQPTVFQKNAFSRGRT